MTRLTYPPALTVDQVDDYHGTRVADPYRWLEDADSAQTAAWVAAQNELTFAYLEGIPARQARRPCSSASRPKPVTARASPPGSSSRSRPICGRS
jgi:hypothetical protein